MAIGYKCLFRGSFLTYITSGVVIVPQRVSQSCYYNMDDGDEFDNHGDGYDANHYVRGLIVMVNDDDDDVLLVLLLLLLLLPLPLPPPPPSSSLLLA